MRAKLGVVKNYVSINETKDNISFLRDIKGVSYEYDRQRNPYLALDDDKLKYYAYSQK